MHICKRRRGASSSSRGTDFDAGADRGGAQEGDELILIIPVRPIALFILGAVVEIDLSIQQQGSRPSSHCAAMIALRHVR